MPAGYAARREAAALALELTYGNRYPFWRGACGTAPFAPLKGQLVVGVASGLVLLLGPGALSLFYQ